MKTDLHTHTIASGHAFGTVQENAKAAKDKGISLLAITDHGPSIAGSAREIYFGCGNRLPKTIEGVRVLFGVETSIINEAGDLDLPDSTLSWLDFVIAGLHYDCGYDDLGVERNTETLIKAMQNKYVKVISHPYGRELKVDMEKVTRAAIDNNVLLELNASYFYMNRIDSQEVWDGIQTMVRILKDNGQKILINSDAHSPYEVGRFEEVISQFPRLGLSHDDILNYDPEAALKLLGCS